MKRRILGLLKLAVPVAIIAWLAVDIQRNDPETFSRLRDQPKHWGVLLVAALTCFGGVVLTFLRWYCLVRALRIPFGVRDAFRLGFLGYLLNFVSLGSVGGDLFKALFIAREQRSRRLEAVATIVVDRIVGMCALLLVTSIAILVIELPGKSTEIQTIARATLLVTAALAGAAVLTVLFGKMRGKAVAFLAGVPRLGTPIQRTVTALGMYRHEKPLLVAVAVMSPAVPVLFTVAVYLAARGLYADAPTLLEHFIICPMAGVVAALPISPSGLGTYELAMKYLYDHVPAGGSGDGKGVVVALAFRAMQVVVACIGVMFYWLNRRQVMEVLQDAEESPGQEQGPLTNAHNST